MIITRGYGAGWGTEEDELVKDIINFIDKNCEKFEKEDETSGYYDNNIKISLVGDSSVANRYIVKLYNKDSTKLYDKTMILSSADSGTVRIAENTNNNCTVLEFTSPKTTIMGQIIFIETQAGKLVGYNNNDTEDALKSGIGDGSTTLKPMSVINRLPYSIDSKVEIVQNKIITRGNVFEEKLTSLYDCSLLSPHTQYVINGRNYYTINANTLMEV